jgi:hypothetical protein
MLLISPKYRIINNIVKIIRNHEYNKLSIPRRYTPKEIQPLPVPNSIINLSLNLISPHDLNIEEIIFLPNIKVNVA